MMVGRAGGKDRECIERVGRGAEVVVAGVHVRDREELGDLRRRGDVGHLGKIIVAVVLSVPVRSNGRPSEPATVTAQAHRCCTRVRTWLLLLLSRPSMSPTKPVKAAGLDFWPVVSLLFWKEAWMVAALCCWSRPVKRSAQLRFRMSLPLRAERTPSSTPRTGYFL